MKKASTSAETYGKQISQKDWEKQHWLLQGSVLRRFCTVQICVTQPVYGTGSCRALSESQRRCSTILPGGQWDAFAPGRKRRQMPVRKSAALTPEKPLALVPEPSGSRAAAGLEKISSLQCNSCLPFGGFMVRSWIACTRCQEYMIPLCDAPCNGENLAILCIPGQFPGESPISFTPTLGSY